MSISRKVTGTPKKGVRTSVLSTINPVHEVRRLQNKLSDSCKDSLAVIQGIVEDFFVELENHISTTTNKSSVPQSSTITIFPAKPNDSADAPGFRKVVTPLIRTHWGLRL
jgi:hypothetical protein